MSPAVYFVPRTVDLHFCSLLKCLLHVMIYFFLSLFLFICHSVKPETLWVFAQLDLSVLSMLVKLDDSSPYCSSHVLCRVTEVCLVVLSRSSASWSLQYACGCVFCWRELCLCVSAMVHCHHEPAGDLAHWTHGSAAPRLPAQDPHQDHKGKRQPPGAVRLPDFALSSVLCWHCLCASAEKVQRLPPAGCPGLHPEQ